MARAKLKPIEERDPYAATVLDAFDKLKMEENMAKTATVEVLDPQTENLPAMTKAEKKRLDELETIIKDNIEGFFKVGFALREIREKKLYREKFGTWEEYCRVLWDMSDRYAEYQIKASNVVDNLTQNSNNCSSFGHLPKNEAQARPLTNLSTDAQVLAWQRVVDTAPDGKITAAHVTRVVKEMVEGFTEKKTRDIRERIDRAEQFSKPFRSGFQTFLDVVWEARANNWKDTSKKAVLKHIDELRAIVNES